MWVAICGLEVVMARVSNRLTAMTVQRLKEPGRYADGGGLYVQVGPTGGKSWLFRYTRQGKAREMGLGAVGVLSLADAREAAASVRQTLATGADPLEAREAERRRHEAEASCGITFAECASAYIEAHKSGWRNEKHAAQWPSTIRTYAEPVFGALPVHLSIPLKWSLLQNISVSNPLIRALIYCRNAMMKDQAIPIWLT